jgi:hypothetical protein
MLPERRRDGRRGQEQEDDETPELCEEQTPWGRVGVLPHDVRADARQPATCFLDAETGLRIDAQELQDPQGRKGVPLATDR